MRPGAAAERGHRLPRLPLVAGVAAGDGAGIGLGLGQNVPLAAHLLERLHALGLEAIALPLRPLAGL